MSLELANTFATFGTFLVIVATAIAAMIQLRHMRSSNHIAALNELRETTETPDFVAAQSFVLTHLSEKVKDAAFRYQMATPSHRTDESQPFANRVFTVGNFYENMGLLIKTGLVDRDLTLEIWGGNIIVAWEQFAPLLSTVRRAQGDAVWENFELLTVMAEDFGAAHPAGTYPQGVRRKEKNDTFLEADRQYAASLAMA